MIVKSKHDAPRQPFTTENGHISWVTSYFGTEPAMDRSLPRPRHDVLYPQAFIVEQEPNYTLDPHFHVANQFQLFIAGEGWMGKARLGAFAVHYAQAYTPYGPIVAGDKGLHYMTLRNGWDGGPRYMPKHREELRASGRPRRHLGPTPIELGAAQPVCEIFPVADDGLGGWIYRVPAERATSGPDPRSGGGQGWVVADGTLVLDGAELPRLSCLFVGPDDEPPAVTGGRNGAEMIVLQFPKWTAPPRKTGDGNS